MSLCPIACLLCLSLPLFSQDSSPASQMDIQQLKQDQKRFRGTFQQELAKLEGSAKRDIAEGRPAKLPADVLEEVGHTRANNRVLGISDPCMERGKAIRTARMRALAIFALAGGSGVQYVSEQYTIQTPSGPSDKQIRKKWEEYAKITATLAYDSSLVKVVDTHFTKYREAIVLVREMKQGRTKHNVTDTLTVKAEVYHLEQQLDKGASKSWQLAFTVQNMNATGTRTWANDYILKIADNAESVRSNFPHTNYTYCPRHYHYLSPVGQDTISRPFVSVKKGLWAGYFNNLLRGLLKPINQNASLIKTVDDQYKQKYENLTRAVTEGTYTFNLTSMSVTNDRLQLGMEVDRR